MLRRATGCVFWLAASVQAQPLPDPTRPPAMATAAPASAAVARAGFAPVPAVPRVLSVQVSKDGRASALVDRRLVVVGDRLGDATVVRIDADGVELRRASGRTDRLPLIDTAIVKQTAPGSGRSTAPPSMASLGRGGPQP